MEITGFATSVKGVADVLNYWADKGIFAYVLPFLLIFAVTYGILSKSKILTKDPDKNRGVNMVVSIAVGMLAIQWGYVPEFFSVIFPYAGMGISILLVVLILTSLFADPTKKGWTNTYFIAGAAIAVIIVLESLADFSWAGGQWWNDYGPALISLAIVGALVGITVGGGKKKVEVPAEK